MIGAIAKPKVTVGVKVLRKDGSVEDHGEHEVTREDGRELTTDDLEILRQKFNKGD